MTASCCPALRRRDSQNPASDPPTKTGTVQTWNRWKMRRSCVLPGNAAEIDCGKNNCDQVTVGLCGEDSAVELGWLIFSLGNSYPSQVRPVEVQRRQAGLVSSHFIRRIWCGSGLDDFPTTSPCSICSNHLT